MGNEAFHNIAIISKPNNIKLALDPGKPREQSITKPNIDSTKNCVNDYMKNTSIKLYKNECNSLKHIAKGTTLPNTSKIYNRGTFAFNQEFLVIEKKKPIYQCYKVVDTLGYGSFGVVKKVINRNTGKIYALKIIKKSHCTQNINLTNEIEILKKLVY